MPGIEPQPDAHRGDGEPTREKEERPEAVREGNQPARGPLGRIAVGGTQGRCSALGRAREGRGVAQHVGDILQDEHSLQLTGAGPVTGPLPEAESSSRRVRSASRSRSAREYWSRTPQKAARFEQAPCSGKVLINGLERYHGHLEGEIPIRLWSIVEAEDSSAEPADSTLGGSVAYPGMQIRQLRVGGHEVPVDAEGYLVEPADWSEEFARAAAAAEGLELTDAHWELIRYLRQHYREHGVQAAVRDMMRHFRAIWGPERGSSRALHRLFPLGGPQKQGNRLAGLLRTKGEH